MKRQEPTPMAITTTAAPRRIDEMLTAARACLSRLTPREAHESARSGAVIIDIRPEPGIRRAKSPALSSSSATSSNGAWTQPATPACPSPITTCPSSSSATRDTPPVWPPRPSRNSASTARPISSAGSAPGAPLAWHHLCLGDSNNEWALAEPATVITATAADLLPTASVTWTGADITGADIGGPPPGEPAGVPP
jgi:hypothetical protein